MESGYKATMLSTNPAPRPGDGHVHLWLWSLDPSSTDLEACWQSLSPDESRRADSFRFEKHRKRFVLARGRLRFILADYIGCRAEEVSFGYGAAGKPHSLTQPESWRLDFNLSHSEDSAALAVSSEMELGVDIELIRPIEEDILPQILSAAEQRQFETLPAARQGDILLESWTRKEACLKALGTGLGGSPARFEFDLARSDDDALLRVGESADEAAQWLVRTFLAPGPCRGAVAARAKGWSLLAMPPAERP
ncbi:4'-phosphopantetheinyl transferase [Labrys miyagiensis]|uniref:4'-phosphopantetheinyl transferase n=1 Tax=Labrys miyagiensis TaxID=346912 RepID=A0ABQ6CM49_9HYPH|nr:4'-phosphopantetheinyl transferase [Labrys miyagiensis]